MTTLLVVLTTVLSFLVVLLLIAFYLNLRKVRGSDGGNGNNDYINAQFQAALEHLKTSNEGTVRLAEEKFQKHNQGAKQSVESSLKPVKEGLDKFSGLLRHFEVEHKADVATRKKEFEYLAKSSAALHDQTQKLSETLRSSKMRGRWGETNLRNIFELAGMTNRVDFLEQVGVRSESSIMRPDVLVRIPNGRCLVVDAKTPLSNYLAALDSGDENERKNCMKRYADDFQAHINALASKEYMSSVKTAFDFVVMFIPSDSFLAAAAEGNPEIIDSAFKKGIVICTPSTIMALLKVVAYGWSQQTAHENATAILETGQELLKRLKKHEEHFAKVGGSLSSAVKHFNSAVGSFKTRVVPLSRTINELSDTKSTPSIGSTGNTSMQEVDEVPRITSQNEV